MNKNLSNARLGIEKVEGIMYAIESTYLTIDVVPEQLDKADKAVNTFYALWDCIRNVKDDLEKLSGDERVVDVIRAVNEERRKNRTLTTE